MSNITRYSTLQRKLHWAVVVLVASQYLMQSTMKSAMTASRNHEPVDGLGFLVTTLHTWGGAAIGAIIVYRLWLRVHNPVEAGGGSLSGVMRWVASAMHWGFYGVLLLMVVTGMLHYYLDVRWVAIWHERGEWLLLVMIFTHVLAALLHHFWKKDDVLREMCRRSPPH